MKKMIRIIIVCLFSMSCSSKIQTIEFYPNEYKLLMDTLVENEIYYPILKAPIHNQLCIKYNNENYYLYQHDFEANFKTDSLLIIKMNNKELKYLNVYLPKKDWVLDFAINDSLLFILSSTYIHKYKYYNDDFSLINSYDIIDSIDNKINKLGYQKIDFFDNSLAIYSSIFGKLYQKPKIKLYNYHTMKVINYKEFENTKGAMLNYEQAKRCFTVYNNRLALSDLSEYNIKIYDKYFNYINSINYQPTNWIYNEYLNEIKDEIDNVSNFDEFRMQYVKKYSMLPKICTVDFINDTCVIISRDLNNNKYSCYDLWIEKDNKWSLVQSDLYDIRKEMAAKYMQNIIGNNYKAFYVFSKYYVVNQNVIIPTDKPIKLDSNIRKMTYEELNKKVERYYENNSKDNTTLLFYKFK